MANSEEGLRVGLLRQIAEVSSRRGAVKGKGNNRRQQKACAAHLGFATFGIALCPLMFVAIWGGYSFVFLPGVVRHLTVVPCRVELKRHLWCGGAPF